MPKKYLCYGCQKIFHFEDLAYECMCFHPKEDAEYRGVCKKCAEQKRDVEIPAQHNLQKIHTYSEEYKRFWRELDQKYPQSGFHFVADGMELTYYEIPTGEREIDKVYEFLDKQGLSVEELANYRKKVVIPVTPEKLREMSKCTCCADQKA